MLSTYVMVSPELNAGNADHLVVHTSRSCRVHEQPCMLSHFRTLVHKKIADYHSKHELDKSLLTYGEGYTGTLRLRSAMAKHLNRHFHPAQAIDAEEITFTAGVTNINEVCALVTCDPGEAIMLGRPIYGPFSKDFVMRTG